MTAVDLKRPPRGVHPGQRAEKGEGGGSGPPAKHLIMVRGALRHALPAALRAADKERELSENGVLSIVLLV